MVPLYPVNHKRFIRLNRVEPLFVDNRFSLNRGCQGFTKNINLHNINDGSYFPDRV